MGNNEYVYVCNNQDCEELHEDQTEICQSCSSTTREVHKSDMQMEDSE
jgi:RNA polymerase subunit RPABC4/transcription elongation factor Spt4